MSFLPTFAALALLSVLSAPGTKTLEGKLKGGVVLSERPGFGVFQAELATQPSDFGVNPPPGAKLFQGTFVFAHKPIKLLWVETPGQSPFIYVDVDANGKFAETERFTFSPVKGEAAIAGVANVAMPISGIKGSAIPIQIILPDPVGMGLTETGNHRTFGLKFQAVVQGEVAIDGKKTRVEYELNPVTGKARPASGWLTMDTNHDGKFDYSRFSPETTFSRGEPVVFRVGTTYVSTVSVDVASGKIVLRTHPASDYQRFELKEGTDLPDFNFTDLEGKERRLAEFRGKYLLIDFWATWCGPCVGELPNLKSAYATFKDRGFEVLAVSGDASSEVVRKFVKERELPWTHATVESTQDLTHKRFRISSWPTTILVDPNGKIVSLGENGELRGETLLKTLDGFFLKQPAGDTAIHR